MKYITGYHALNLPCQLETTGDWHRYCYDWNKPKIKESNKSIFKNYGIETNKDLSFVDLGQHNNVANHIRACLDIIEEGKQASIKYFTSDFLDDNEEIINELFVQCLKFQKTDKWEDIDKFLSKEKIKEWNNVKRRART